MITPTLNHNMHIDLPVQGYLLESICTFITEYNYFIRMHAIVLRTCMGGLFRQCRFC